MKKKRSRFRADDLFGEYREWADNRYNPGHWLGANVPPDTRNLWSPKDRRWLGALFVTTSVLVLGAAIYARNPDNPVWLIALTVLPFLIPGLIMLFSRDHPKRRD
jgi:hypothetical protein